MKWKKIRLQVENRFHIFSKLRHIHLLLPNYESIFSEIRETFLLGRSGGHYKSLRYLTATINAARYTPSQARYEISNFVSLYHKKENLSRYTLRNGDESRSRNSKN